MENKDTLSIFFDNVIKGIEADAKSKNQKAPIDSFRHVQDNDSGQLIGADYFKYLVYGSAPGKIRPIANIQKWAEKYITNPVRENKDGTFSIVPYKSLAWAISVNLSKFGDQIFQGKKKGIDFLGVMEKNMPDLLKSLARNEVLNIATSLRQAVK